jgi:hypothetical protein
MAGILEMVIRFRSIAVLAIFLWWLVLLGVNLHVH